ncbi:MAG: YraN family protein [Anaerolineae bacterium]|jgi:putative endonuclease|nr:YraN family protein [Anaerolineae bacterium]
MTGHRQTLGQRAETLVTSRLQRAGYTILARNWRHGTLGELDIVARQDDEIVFVEVRARRGPLHAAVEQALASVDARKQARLVALAEAYLSAHDMHNTACRIDVAAVGCQDGKLVVEVIKNAVGW